MVFALHPKSFNATGMDDNLASVKADKAHRDRLLESRVVALEENLRSLKEEIAEMRQQYQGEYDPSFSSGRFGNSDPNQLPH